MKILLSGGGTLGPVMPLLAIYEIYRRHNPRAEFIWVGTRKGPEREVVERSKIPFFVIAAGKWRRYWSFWNITDLFKLSCAIVQSFILLMRERPALLISAGGFASVPLHWAAWILGIPTWVHQQDAKVGLANKLMVRTATKITTVLEETAGLFPRGKAEWVGNPVRDLSTSSKEISRLKLGLPPDCPVIFALGGGTGSSAINKLIIEALSHWPSEWQIIHLVGRERPSELAEGAMSAFKNYHVYKFFNGEMKDGYAVADVVIARAGFGTITELATLQKAAILLPMSETHQEENVRALAKEKAIIVLDERTTEGVKLAQVVKDLINRPDVREYLGKRLNKILPPAKPEKIIIIIEELVSEF